MFKEVVRALRMPVYVVATMLLTAAYVFAYYDYVHSLTTSPKVSVSGPAR